MCWCAHPVPLPTRSRFVDIIAWVDYAHLSDDERSPIWCKLTPVVEAEGDRWERIDDRASSFPPRGGLFWPRPDPAVEQDTLWRGSPVDQVAVEGDRDRYAFRSAVPVVEFWSPEIRDPVLLRRGIANRTLVMYRKPVGPVFVRLGSATDRWIGPIEFAWTNGSWHAQPAAGGFVDIVCIPGEQLQNIKLEAFSVRVLRPGQHLPAPCGSWNVQDDETLLRTLSKWAKRLSPELGDALRTARETWRRYAEGIAELGETARSHDIARKEAIDALLERTEDVVANAQVVVEAVLEHPVIQAQLRAEIDRRASEAEAEIREQGLERLTDLRAQIAKEEATLTDLAESTGQQKELLQRQRRELTDLSARREHLAGQIAADTQELVAGMLADPIGQLLREPLVRGLIANSRPSGAPIPPVGALPDLNVASDAVPEASVDEVSGKLRVFSASADLDPQVGSSLMAAVVTGRATMLSGARALSLATTFGRLASGPNAWFVHTPASIFGLGDLLDSPASRSFSESGDAARLGDVLTAAADSEHWVCVILVGVNRAPLELVLGDIVSILDVEGDRARIPWQPEASELSRAVRIGGPVRWLATMAAGKTTFKIPVSLAHRVAFVDCDRESSLETASFLDTMLPASRLAVAAVESFRSTASEWSEPDALPRQLRRVARVELPTYTRIFDDPAAGLAEWLCSRVAVLHGDAKLMEFAERLGEPYASKLSDLLQTGTAERIRKLVEETA